MLSIKERIVLIVLAVSQSVAGQVHAAQKPEFEEASIHPMPAARPGTRITGNQTGGPGTKDPELFRCFNCSLATLVTRAYNVRSYQFEGPDWLAAQQFLLTAKVPPGTTKERFEMMLQRLLEERFKLAYHWGQKYVQGFELVVAKGGPKLREHKDEAPGVSDKASTPNAASERVLRFNNWTMDQLSAGLTSPAGKPVVNATQIRGTYDIDLHWQADQLTAAAPGVDTQNVDNQSGITLFSAVRSQLGLALEPKRIELKILVIDSVEKTSAEN